MHNKKLNILFLFLFSFAALTRSQTQKSTSLNHDEENYNKVEELVAALHEEDTAIFWKLYYKYYKEAKTNKNYFLETNLAGKRGIYYYYHNKPKLAISYLDSALQISKKQHLEEATLAHLMNRGAVYFTIGNYSASLNDYKASERLMIKNKSPKIGGLLGNISLLYQEIGDLENAKKYLYRSMPFVKLDKQIDSYTKALNNLALIHKKEKNYKAADSLFRLGYNLCKENNLDDDLSDVLYNLVELLTIQKKYEEAKKLNVELLEHVAKTKDASWTKLVTLDLANLNYLTGNKGAAKKYLSQAENISTKESGEDTTNLDLLNTLATLYLNLGFYEKSARTFLHYVKSDQRNIRQHEVLNLQQLTYKYEKQQDSVSNAKEKEITELRNIHNQEKASVKLHQQQIILIASLVGLFGIIVFALFLVKANRSKEKANIEILSQKKLITEKNKEITDSITYAKRIQHSLLPLSEYIEILLPSYFLLYKPKDIVSGDFYWIKKINAAELFIAVADCTGHGVPGAMMSALSIQNLNELSRQTHSPSELLVLLNADLKKTLNQDQEGFSKDGLDICLCKINLKEKKITYSGANRSLLVFDANGLKQEVKATKAGIAGHTSVDQFYEEHELVLKTNDLIVLSTDGFADQFGGEKNKKITTKRFKEWIISIYNNDNKHLELEKLFLNWKLENDQIDDVCVLGFNI